MKVAVVGSRDLNVDLTGYIPEGVTQIVSGGARGIDTLAEQYAHKNNIPVKIFKPDTALFGKWAYLARNDQIVQEADIIVAIWDGKSRGTYYTINQARKHNKPVNVHIISKK